jgi:hypothetical protein
MVVFHISANGLGEEPFLPLRVDGKIPKVITYFPRLGSEIVPLDIEPVLLFPLGTLPTHSRSNQFVLVRSKAKLIAELKTLLNLLLLDSLLTEQALYFFRNSSTLERTHA